MEKTITMSLTEYDKFQEAIEASRKHPELIRIVSYHIGWASSEPVVQFMTNEEAIKSVVGKNDELRKNLSDCEELLKIERAKKRPWFSFR